MMFPGINKLLDLLRRFGRNRKYLLLSFNIIAKEVDRVLFPSLAFTSSFSTRAAGQGDRALQHIGQLIKEPFFAWIHGNLLSV